MNEPVNERVLGAAAAEFPPVECECPTCEGEETVMHPEHNHPVVCHECEGRGVFYREMDAREEHYYIMHLLKTRYQFR